MFTQDLLLSNIHPIFSIRITVFTIHYDQQGHILKYFRFISNYITIAFNYLFRLQFMPDAQFLYNFIAGGLSGIVAKTICAPIERVKLLIQTDLENDKIGQRYKGITDCFNRCIKQQGFWSLWRGNWVNVIRYFPTQALNFSFKDYFGKLLRREKGAPKWQQAMVNILSGGLAGCCSTIFVYPLDFSRTRLGVDYSSNHTERQFTGLGDCIKKTYKSQGLIGLYRGFDVALVSIFLYRGLYFGTFDTGKAILLTPESSWLMMFLWAQFSVIFSETLAYPGDTIKRKMMMQSCKKQKMYSSSIDCIKKTYNQVGLLGFWRGSMSNIIRSFGSSLCLVFYEKLQEARGPIKAH